MLPTLWLLLMAVALSEYEREAPGRLELLAVLALFGRGGWVRWTGLGGSGAGAGDAEGANARAARVAAEAF